MNLMRTALIIALAGIIILGILSQNTEPKLIRISEINFKMVDNYVKINVSIKNSNVANGLTLLKLHDSAENSEINAVWGEKENFSAGINAEIIGRVKEYQGNLEIEIEKIKIL